MSAAQKNNDSKGLFGLGRALAQAFKPTVAAPQPEKNPPPEKKPPPEIPALSPAAQLRFDQSLCTTVEDKNLEAVKGVIACGANVDFFDGLFTPLHVAARDGSADILRVLLEHSKEPDKKVKNFGTPLRIAVKNNQLETMKLLLDVGAVPRRTTQDLDDDLLLYSLYHCKPETTLLLLEKGASVGPGWRGNVPITVAAAKGYLDVVKKLVALGADVNAFNPEDGQTAMFKASQSLDPDVIDYLARVNADANIPNTKGMTPLAETLNQHTRADDIIISLLKAGATPFRQFGKDALMIIEKAASWNPLVHQAEHYRKLGLEERGSEMSDALHAGSTANVTVRKPLRLRK